MWVEVCKYLNRRFISADTRVLEIGSGYGDFIGNIRAKERVAIEHNIFFREYFDEYPGVTVHFLDASFVLETLPESSFDSVFCSNYFEHFEVPEIQHQLGLISNVLKNGGKLIVLQPNFQLCSKFYFDDWTHKAIFSHASFSDFLEVHGFHVDKCFKRFLPFSMKSRFPKFPLLIRMYLLSPWKPFAGQMLVIASKK